MASVKIYKDNEGNVRYSADALSITLYEDYCEWSYGAFSKETANIYYSDINAVSYVNGSLFSYSAFQISTNGRNYSARPVDKYSNMNIIAEAIEQKRAQARQKNTSSKVSVADEIEKLKKLADQGIISKSEFEAKKKQILGL